MTPDIETKQKLHLRFSDICSARRFIRQDAQLEAVDTDRIWPFYKSDKQSYWKDFQVLYERDETFETKLITKRENGQRVCALDLMGTGEIFYQLPIAAGLAVTLADTRSEGQKTIDNSHGFSIVEGWGIGQEKSRDILSKHTWWNIRKWLDEMGFAGFQTAFCRPIAGFNNLPKDFAVFSWLFQQAWSCLDPDGGELLTAIPSRFADKLDGWIYQVATPHRIRAVYIKDVLRLTRRANNPESLPLARPKT